MFTFALVIGLNSSALLCCRVNYQRREVCGSSIEATAVRGNLIRAVIVTILSSNRNAEEHGIAS
jgi:hypothetical protein